MSLHNSDLYKLSMGESVTSSTGFCSPIDEYRAAFADREHLFLNYYTFQDGDIQKRTDTLAKQEAIKYRL